MKSKRIIGSDITDSLSKKVALDIPEDNRLRSQYMRNIINEDNRDIPKRNALAIPHILVQFWNDATTIPLDVQKCIDSWKPIEERGFERLLFNDESARQFIKENFDRRYLDAFKRCKHPAMRSDYFRLCFIMVNGGIYVDADDVYEGVNFESCFYDKKIKLKPLCYNSLTDSMVKISDFIVAPRDSQELIFYVNNNPIIAPSNNPIICMALERATQILLNQIISDKQDVQSTTGPGNLTICLVRHAIETDRNGIDRDFTLLTDWDEVCLSQWPLEYRQDKRNWRLWDGHNR